MALTEQRILKSIETLPAVAAINVCWVDQVLRDGEVISEIPYRCAYGADQKEKFEAEVDGAEHYVAAMGWQ